MDKTTKCDVVIVGTGPAGIFAAMNLIEQVPNIKIVMVERGLPLDKRIRAKTSKGQSWLFGWGGAGAFSDGKLTLTADVGGLLGDLIGLDELSDLIERVDQKYLTYGAPEEISGADKEGQQQLANRAARAGLRLVPMRIRHMGSDITRVVLELFYRALEGKVKILFGKEVKTLVADKKSFKGVELADGQKISARFGIIAVGRAGAEWLQGELGRLDLRVENNAVDIGVRVEVPAVVTDEVTSITHEAKLLYTSRHFDDHVRTFCMNPRGEVVEERLEDIITVNGHSYKHKKTDRTNFALLVSTKFTEPFHDPIAYGKSIARLSNLIGGGVIVQRLGDLLSGRRSTHERISRNLIAPSLKSATPGDISFVLPYRYMANILEMLEALDSFMPGVWQHQTLLYAVEVKFYSIRPKLTSELESEVSGMFIVGDGAGVSRGLVQASASGLIASNAIAKRIQSSNM